LRPGRHCEKDREQQAHVFDYDTPNETGQNSNRGGALALALIAITQPRVFEEIELDFVQQASKR